MNRISFSIRSAQELKLPLAMIPRCRIEKNSPHLWVPTTPCSGCSALAVGIEPSPGGSRRRAGDGVQDDADETTDIGASRG
jgi:hypothetical protein